MEPIRVNKIVIQGIKGVLKPVELSLGKSSKPCSLAIFAPNACGKSGIADALEYFFNEKGEIEHLGIRSDSETGGKAAIPHIYAGKSKIKPEVSLTFHGGSLLAPLKVAREVKTGTKDSLPLEIVDIIDSARAVRILRQHDLRRFIVDYEPARKYEEISRWVGLERLDALRAQIQKAQSEFNKKGKQEAINERLTDISKKTNQAVQTFDENSTLEWINNVLLKGIEISTQLESLSDTKGLFDELDAFQVQEDKKLGINLFQDFVSAIPSLVDDKDSSTALRDFSFEAKIIQLQKAFSELDALKIKAKNINYKELWQHSQKLLVDDRLEYCPLCETEWPSTKYKSRRALAKIIESNLATLKEVTDAEERVAEAITETREALQNDKSLLLTIKERAKSANLPISDKIEKGITTCIDNLLKVVDAKTCKDLKDVPQVTYWQSFTENAKTEILARLKEAEKEIAARTKESPDLKRFHNAKTIISGIIESKVRYDSLRKEQEEYERIGDSLSKVASTIRDAVKNQMKTVLSVLKKDLSAIYKKISRASFIPEILIEVPDEKTASLNLRISFYDLKDSVSPGGYLSESYINTLGIAIFLAAVKNFNSSFPFIVLDDIVSSYDAEHRGYIVDIIAEDFRDYQMILTTHDYMFYKHLRHRLQDKNWRFKQIKDWKIDSGPRLHDEVADEKEIESLLSDKTAYQVAGNVVRVYMEEWFDKICEEFWVHTPHKRGMQDYTRTLFDYWTPFINQVKSFGKPFQEWLDKQTCYDRLKGHHLINYYSHYQSNPYEWGNMSDVEYIWKNFIEFKALFRCQQCSGKLSYRSGEDKKPYCKKCGEWPNFK